MINYLKQINPQKIRTQILKMKVIILKISIILIAFLAINHQLISKFQIAEKPIWIENIEYNTNNNKKINSGYYYLLIDKQEHISKKHKYYHTVIKINNNSGIQQMSDLEFIFDPKYQRLNIHNITINRNGKIINQLTAKNIKTLQKETELSNYVYNGKETAYLNLEDVRSGDIIDYSYSIIGQNPNYDNKIFGNIYLNYSVPYNKLNFSIILPKNNNVVFKEFNTKDKLKSQYIDVDYVKYYIQKDNVDAVEYDSNVPSWYEPYSFITFSDTKDLTDLVKWASKLFIVKKEQIKILESKIKKMFGEGIDEEKIIKIIRFVQDDIRYLSNNDGINSHKPASPLNVFTKRFGDCKSKSLLLVEILKIYGLEAHPVLLNTYNDEILINLLPSPNLFNHCIVKLKYNGNEFYIDPTMSDQGGNLENIYIPNYKNLLVIKEGNSFYSSTKVKNGTKTTVEEIYVIKGKDVFLDVYTIYTNSDADDQRSWFKEQELYQITQSYEQYYSAAYPNIKSIEEIKINDNRNGKNYIEVWEKYQIENALEIKEDNPDFYNINVYSPNLNYYISVSKSPKRTMPYELTYPINYSHKMIIKHPNVDANDKSVAYTSNSYDFSYKIKKENHGIEIKYQYLTKLPYIIADSVGSFIKIHDKMLKIMSHDIPIPIDPNKSAKIQDSSDEYESVELAGINYFATIGGLVFILIAIYCIYYIYNYYDVEVDIIDESFRQFGKNIGGWLLFLVISLSLGFLSNIGLIVKDYKNIIYNVDTSFANDLSNSFLFFYNLDKILHMADLVFLLFGCFLVIMLLLSKRSIFPIIFKYFLIIGFIFSFIMLISNIITTDLSNGNLIYDSKERIGILIRSFISGIIWILYLVRSRRVQETFIKFAPKNYDKFNKHQINSSEFDIQNNNLVISSIENTNLQLVQDENKIDTRTELSNENNTEYNSKSVTEFGTNNQN